ncbi:MAG: helix-turn-helix domain-containing protein [Oscillospiraceae bacterium]|nr:helix-turn-helix domain-containing protein [Oscillospiraceae bacterium]
MTCEEYAVHKRRQAQRERYRTMPPKQRAAILAEKKEQKRRMRASAAYNTPEARAERRAYNQRWYAENRERMKEYKREYYQAHKEELRIWDSQYKERLGVEAWREMHRRSCRKTAEKLRQAAEQIPEGVAADIRAWRERRALTQKQMAELSGAEQSKISKMERRKVPPTEDTLQLCGISWRPGDAAYERRYTAVSQKLSACNLCTNAWCSWHESHTPVPGWRAKKEKLNLGHKIVDTYHVTGCPEFREDMSRPLL